MEKPKNTRSASREPPTAYSIASGSSSSSASTNMMYSEPALTVSSARFLARAGPPLGSLRTVRRESSAARASRIFPVRSVEPSLTTISSISEKL